MYIYNTQRRAFYTIIIALVRAHTTCGHESMCGDVIVLCRYGKPTTSRPVHVTYRIFFVFTGATTRHEISRFRVFV